MRVLVTGGGTGGHVNPGLAIANTIKENDPGAQIAYVGTPRGIENKLVPAAGYKLYHVDVMGLRRKLTPANIKAAYLALTSPHKAKKIIEEFNPDIVIGTGGYVSWPVVKAACGMGIPTALHESNAVPGMAVRMLSGSVDRIYLNFEEAASGLDENAKKKVLRVGCPLLSNGSGFSREDAFEKLGIPKGTDTYVLSFGGSMGAEKVNDAVFTLMERCTGGKSGVRHTHATGSIEKDIAAGWFKERGLDKYDNLELLEYIYDMPYRMAAADIVISRAGAMTIAELARAGKCAVLIPSPNVTDNQQYKNAKVLADKGAAILIPEDENTGETLVREVSRLLAEPGLRKSLESNIAVLGKDDANKLIYNDIVKLVREKKKS